MHILISHTTRTPCIDNWGPVKEVFDVRGHLIVKTPTRAPSN